MLFAGERTHRQIHRQIFNQYSKISSHSFGCLPLLWQQRHRQQQRWRGQKKQKSTKSSSGNSDGNGDDDSNDNDDENKGNGIIDSSAAMAVAAGWRQQKCGGGRQCNQYIPNWNCLLFNWVLSWWRCVTYCLHCSQTIFNISNKVFHFGIVCLIVHT